LRTAKLGPEHPDTLLSLGRVAASLVKLNRSAQAVPVIDDCVRRAAGKVVDPGLFPALLEMRLRHYEKMKNAQGCRETAEIWENLNRTDAGGQYAAARMRAVTAAVLHAANKSPAVARQADDEADRAMARLKQAIAAGYRDAGAMKNDKDLDVLRQRDDFKKL